MDLHGTSRIEPRSPERPFERLRIRLPVGTEVRDGTP
jgi:hypothetical protein